MDRRTLPARIRLLVSRGALSLVLLCSTGCNGERPPTEIEEGLRWIHISGPYVAVAVDGEELPFRVHDLEGCQEVGAAHWLMRVDLLLSASQNPSGWTEAEASVTFRDDACNGAESEGGEVLSGAYRAREDSLFLEFDGSDSLDLETGPWIGDRVDLRLRYRERSYVATLEPG